MDLPPPVFLSTVVARTAIVLLVVVVGIRFFGKRQVGELNLFDIALVLLLGNAVQNAITYGSGDLWVGLISAGTLLAIERVMGAVFTRYPRVEKELLGEPTVVVTGGKFDHRAMKKQGVTDEQIFAAMRDHGLHDLSELRVAVLEPDGDISIIPREGKGGS